MSGMYKDYAIFAGNGNLPLAKEICKYLGKPLGDATVKKFSDGEVAVNINESVRGKDCYIIQSTSDPVNDNLMELCILIDAMKRASAGRINAVIPYFGYGRQDRTARPRDPITARLVADIISVAGAERVITMDLHAPQIQGFFNIPTDHLLGSPILVNYFKSQPHENVVIVSPDHGSVKRARDMAAPLDVPIAIIDKRRPKPNVSEIMNIIGDIEGKDRILIDDMVDTAGTICNAANALKERGAKSVRACATHGVLSGPAIDRIQASAIEEMVFLNTIEIPEEKHIAKFKYLSVARVFGETIRRVYHNEPLSSLFEK